MSRTAEGSPAARPALSLILCSRNDSYMGNSRWRLETTLNYAAEQVEKLGRSADVEIVLADWGSEIPLREVLQLTPAAARITSFIWVRPEIARPLQKDSAFPEVLALNAAVRRARGLYIGRIDQDTLVGRRFLEVFFDLCQGTLNLEAPAERALLFSNVRMIPYRFAVRCPPQDVVEQFVRQFDERLKVEISHHTKFYANSVGIWLMSSALWHECGGYDEDMLYMNSMEIDMIERLSEKHAIIDLGKLIDYSFYHLEHYHPWVPRKSSVYRKTNDSWVSKGALHPNTESWGLAQYDLPADRCASPHCRTAVPRRAWRIRDRVMYAASLAVCGAQVLLDLLRAWWLKRLQLEVWRRRTKVVRDTIRGAPVGTWHRLLRELWVTRREARRTLARPE